MTARAPQLDWLKLDHVVSSQVRVRRWERARAELATGKPTGHDAVELALVESGTVRYTVGGRELLASARQLVIVPHGMVHTTSFLTPMRGVALWLGAELVGEIAETMGRDVVAPLMAPRLLPLENGRIRTLLGVLHEEVTEGGPGHTRAAEAIAESIIIEMLRRAPRDAPGSGAQDPRVRAAVAHMHASLADPIGLDDLARAARMSRFHFSRLFRDETGQAPYQYLLRLRVTRAQELLRSGDSSVTEAAIATGFSDFSRFASTFKKHTGKRPVDVLRGARSA
jgi:AraC family transcriptional regulator